MLSLGVLTGNLEVALVVNLASNLHLLPVRPLMPLKSSNSKLTLLKSHTENGFAARIMRPNWRASWSLRPNVTSWKLLSKNKKRRPYECSKGLIRCLNGTAVRKCTSNTKSWYTCRKEKKRGLRKSKNKISASLNSKNGSKHPSSNRGKTRWARR